MGSKQHTNVPETTHIGVSNNWAMQSKMVFNICKGKSCSSFYVKEFDVIVHKKVFSLYDPIKFLAILYPKSLANLVVEVETTSWRHQMETFSALLAVCAGNSPVTGEFPAQKPVTRSFDILFGLRLNKRLSQQSWGWWFETPSRPLWRHGNEA